MFEVNCTNSLRLHFGFALTFAKLESFIFTDMKKLTGKQFVEFFIPIRDQLVASLLLRRKHVAIRCLREFCIFLQTKRLMEMSESLLLGHQLDVIVTRVRNELANFCRRQ